LLDSAHERRVSGLFLVEKQTEHGGMIEPTFDWREQLAGSAGGARAGGLVLRTC
jgi:hypothetical protein